MRVNDRLLGATALVNLARWTPPECDDPEEEPEALREDFQDSVLSAFSFVPTGAPAYFEGGNLSDSFDSLLWIKRAQERAQKLLGELIEFAHRYDRLPEWRATLEKRPGRLFADQKELILRFLCGADLKFRFSDWSWNPVFETLDDMLRSAVAHVLISDAAKHLGKCEQCGAYYVSKRRASHHFCPDTDCRNRFWQRKTGSQRVKRSRATRRRLEKKGLIKPKRK